MELKLLFIEGNDNLFMLDELFNRKMKDLDKSIADEIINQIIMNANGLPVKETYSQTIYGVVKKSNPFFFKLDFIHEEEYIPYGAIRRRRLLVLKLMRSTNVCLITNVSAEYRTASFV